MRIFARRTRAWCADAARLEAAHTLRAQVARLVRQHPCAWISKRVFQVLCAQVVRLDCCERIVKFDASRTGRALADVALRVRKKVLISATVISPGLILPLSPPAELSSAILRNTPTACSRIATCASARPMQRRRIRSLWNHEVIPSREQRHPNENKHKVSRG